jgi:cytochrome c553
MNRLFRWLLAGQRTPGLASRLLLVAGLALVTGRLAAAAELEPVPDTLAQRLLACTACHGRDGRSTLQGYVPRIAGKPAGYLFNQLRHFRDGRRPHPGMARLLQFMTDDYLREIAGHFAALEVPYARPLPPAAPAAVLARGRQLALQGDAARQLPACAQCHGQALMGVAPAIPGLLGLPRDYLVSQLGNWQGGQRHAAAPDCMARLSQRLDGADLGAVTAWLAAQPVPQPAAPASGLPQPLPLDCGSAAP